MKQINNPLKGKLQLQNGEIEIKKGVLYGGQMNPKLNSREWFYLLLNGFEKEIPKWANEWANNLIGSRSTEWRIRKSLIKKGYKLN